MRMPAIQSVLQKTGLLWLFYVKLMLTSKLFMNIVLLSSLVFLLYAAPPFHPS